MATPLKPAAGRGYSIDLKNPIDGFTKLHRACWLGNQDDVRNCLKTIPIHSKDAEKRTPLHMAAAAGHTSIVLILMERDLNFNDRDAAGKTAIMKAIEGSHKETAKTMVGKGVDLTATDFNGNTAMHIAIRGDHIDIAQVMLRYFPNCNLTDADGATPLHLIAEGIHTKMARKFIDQGASVNALDNRGRTPLMMACKRGFFPMVSLFLKHGSNPHIKDSNGWSSMDYASIMGYPQVINILEKYLKGEAGNEKESESSISSSEDEDELKGGLHSDVSFQRVVPIRIESETMFHKRKQRMLLAKEMAEKAALWKKGEGIRDTDGNLFPMPDVIASLQAQADKLGDIHKWLLNHQKQLDQKIKDRDELKEHAKKLWEERKKLIDNIENRKNRIKELSQKLQNAPSIKETEVLQDQVDILNESIAELKQQYEKIVAERDDLQSIYDEGNKLHKNSKVELKEKAEQLAKENDMLYAKLTEIQNQARDVTTDLGKKCNVADDLVNNLKILLRGTYRLLEEKHSEVNRVMNEVDAQQYLITKTKDSCNVINGENVKVGQNIDDVENRMKSIKKRLAKIHRELDKYPLTKSLIDAGIIKSEKPPVEEPKKKWFACCRRNGKERESSTLYELKPEIEVRELASKQYDPTKFMTVKTEVPTVCETNMEQIRYSWLNDDQEQTAESLAENMHFLLEDIDQKTEDTNSPRDIPEQSPSNITQETSEETIPSHLQAKLAVVAAKYSK